MFWSSFPYMPTNNIHLYRVNKTAAKHTNDGMK